MENSQSSTYAGRGSSKGQGQWRGRGGWRGNWRGRGNSGNRGQGSWKTKRGSSQTVVSRPVPRPVSRPQTPYSGWYLYFPNDVYSSNSPTVTKIKVFEKYFANWKTLYKYADVERAGHFSVDFSHLSTDQVITEGVPDLADDLKQAPESIINCLGLAMHQTVCWEMSRDATDSVSDFDSLSSSIPPSIPLTGSQLPKIHCQITGYQPITALKNLKANYYGKFVSVRGTVVRVSNIKPLCTHMMFECSTCSTPQCVELPDGKYTVPTACPGDNCRSRSFQAKKSHSMTQTIDWQTIRLQEIVNDSQRESGRIPRTVDCELTNHLVDACVPGDIVTLSGVVKVTNAEEGSRGRQKDQCMFLLYIFANSLQNAKGQVVGRGGDVGHVGSSVDFSLKELYAIEEIHSQPELFRLIVASLCPSICGHEMVKAGLVLGLFGGTQKYANSSDHIPVRGDPHVLVVGDPGLGKSQMLQAVSHVAPRSVYVCGNTTTTSGLTVTLCRESGGGGDYALEAGALVLADQGCCCIDEFDKMTSQHQALLEAMEQQSISIAKAGIVCSLPARTSILAAANPVGGHYNKAKTVSENLKMGSALLSRFDLVFILLDKPDEQLDSLLSAHVMALHANKKRPSTNLSFVSTPQTQQEAEMKRQLEADRPLSERLKVPPAQTLDLIPAQLLRKYVSYARKYVQPRMTPQAASIIQEFYLKLRERHQSQDSTPITTRQLESLIRLSEARARVELREEVCEQDARDVIEIMKYSMMDVFTDDFGFVQFQRSQHGSGMSSRSQAKKFVAVLQRVSQQTCNALFTVQEMRQLAKDTGINVSDFENFVSSLNNQGYLIKKGPRVYQLQISDL